MSGDGNLKAGGFSGLAVGLKVGSVSNSLHAELVHGFGDVRHICRALVETV